MPGAGERLLGEGIRISGFGANLHALGQVATRFNDPLSAEQRSIADQIQGSSQASPKVGDVSEAAAFQQAWYDWTQTVFEDLQAGDDLLTETGRALNDTVKEYQDNDKKIAEDLALLGDLMGGGAR